MAELECPTIQDLMNTAYERWQKNDDWSKDDFRVSLDAWEKIAVHTGNLNYQVENGGFSQWYFNNYYTPEVLDFLIELCNIVMKNENEDVYEVESLLIIAKDRISDFEIDKENSCSFCEYGCDCEPDEDGDDADFYCNCECECVEEPDLEGLDNVFYEHNNSFVKAVEAYLNYKMGVKEN